MNEPNLRFPAMSNVGASMVPGFIGDMEKIQRGGFVNSLFSANGQVDCVIFVYLFLCIYKKCCALVTFLLIQAHQMLDSRPPPGNVCGVVKCHLQCGENGRPSRCKRNRGGEDVEWLVDSEGDSTCFAEYLWYVPYLYNIPKEGYCLGPNPRLLKVLQNHARILQVVSMHYVFDATVLIKLWKSLVVRDISHTRWARCDKGDVSQAIQGRLNAYCKRIIPNFGHSGNRRPRWCHVEWGTFDLGVSWERHSQFLEASMEADQYDVLYIVLTEFGQSVGSTLLMQALRSRSQCVFRKMLEHYEGDQHELGPIRMTESHPYCTMLHYAAAWGTPHVCRELLAIGIDVSSTGDVSNEQTNELGEWKEEPRWNTPLHMVMARATGYQFPCATGYHFFDTGFVRERSERYNVAKFLIENGADVNAEDSSGYSPLDVACGFVDTDDIVLLLVRSGADVTHVSPDRRRPIDTLVDAMGHALRRGSIDVPSTFAHIVDRLTVGVSMNAYTMSTLKWINPTLVLNNDSVKY